MTDFGVFVEIVPGIEGVVFTSELDEKKLEKPSDAFAVGDERNAKIIKMNPKAKKISLSFKQAQFDIQKQEFQTFMESQDDRMTLGDIMKDQLKNLKAPKREPKRRTPMIKADLINKISQELSIPKQEAEEGRQPVLRDDPRGHPQGRGDRDPRLRQLPVPQADVARRAQPPDGRAGQGPAEESPLLQAEQAPQGADQQVMRYI